MASTGDHNTPNVRRVILLLGSPRSGTTWLAKILDTYPHVFYSHEPLSKLQHPGVRETVHKLSRTGVLDPAERSAFLATLAQAHHRCYLPPFLPKPFLRRRPSTLTAGWMFVNMVRRGYTAFHRFAAPDSAARFDLLIKEVDWHPHARRIVDGLRPDHLVVIVRHPCGVVSSQLRGVKHGFLRGHDRHVWLDQHAPRCADLGYPAQAIKQMHPSEFYALDWLLQNLTYLQIVRDHPNAFLLPYEDLCCDPLGTAEALFRFLGWEMTEHTARFLKASTTPTYRTRFVNLLGGRRSYYNLQRDPEYAASAWRTALSPEDHRRIMAVVDSFPRRDWWPEEACSVPSLLGIRIPTRF